MEATIGFTGFVVLGSSTQGIKSPQNLMGSLESHIKNTQKRMTPYECKVQTPTIQHPLVDGG